MTSVADAGHGDAVRDLLAWGGPRLRDLPWRATRDPWAVLVAETMLQQTQVARVVGPFQQFCSQFPTPAACASSDVGDVVRAWAGLGFNRRAVLLHRAATAIVERHAGTVPQDLDSLLALPGVGPYTARAVLVFAFEAPGAVVDTNVGRVLARAFVGSRLTAAQAQQLADELVPADDSWRWNQVLLDFGAQVCTKRQPHCTTCPLHASCRWAETGFAEPDPAIASAGTSSPQSRFEGSDRQGRGRLVAALRDGPVARDDIAVVAGWPRDCERAERVAQRLVEDGVAVVDGRWLTLPRTAPGDEDATARVAS
ncbi:MAG: A/G-specific adenine glycosylase [Nitriliruptoraceae bacterium]